MRVYGVGQSEGDSGSFDFGGSDISASISDPSSFDGLTTVSLPSIDPALAADLGGLPGMDPNAGIAGSPNLLPGTDSGADVPGSNAPGTILNPSSGLTPNTPADGGGILGPDISMSDGGLGPLDVGLSGGGGLLGGLGSLLDSIFGGSSSSGAKPSSSGGAAKKPAAAGTAAGSSIGTGKGAAGAAGLGSSSGILLILGLGALLLLGGKKR